MPNSMGYILCIANFLAYVQQSLFLCFLMLYKGASNFTLTILKRKVACKTNKKSILLNIELIKYNALRSTICISLFYLRKYLNLKRKKVRHKLNISVICA